MKKFTTSERLKEIMDIRGLKQIDILNLAKPLCSKYKVKLGRNDISQYVSGKVEPRQNKLYILAKALNVNEAWLMGYDVKPDRESSVGSISQDFPSPQETREKIVLMGYRYLDESDKGFILGEIRQLLRQEKYKDTNFTLNDTDFTL